MLKASIIIRTRNEERWIAACLRAVLAQDYPSFEIVLVDNNSTDRTVARAASFGIDALSIDTYLPGKALNVGIRSSTGDFVVCLSGHCIPETKQWLSALLKPFEDPKVAGVYGRQRPLSYSSARDKRDLLTVFGMDRRVQVRDTFFHNANSAIRRELWDQVPFDEEVTNIEDRVWAKQMIERGFRLVYEPDASVYHYHGIHQDGDLGRAQNVVRIIESLNIEGLSTRNRLDAAEQQVIAIIPVRGEVPMVAGRSLLDYTIDSARESTLVRDVVVVTDNEQCATLAAARGASVIRRPQELSEDFVDLDAVLAFALEDLERRGHHPDLIVAMSITFPFREPGFVDRLIRRLADEGSDSVLPVHQEFRSCWKADDDGVVRLDQGFVPRKYKKPIYIGLRGLGFITHPHCIREGAALGAKVALEEIADPRCAFEVRDEIGLYLGEKLIPEWRQTAAARR